VVAATAASRGTSFFGRIEGFSCCWRSAYAAVGGAAGAD
jgi:hypothetical protein